MTHRQSLTGWRGRCRGLISWVRSPLHALIIMVVTALVGAAIGWGCDWYATQHSKGHPLAVYVEPLLDRDDPPLLSPGKSPDVFDPRSGTIELVVPDPHRLPRVLPPRPSGGGDCAELWRIGVDSGGQPPTSARYKLVFTNTYRGGELSIIQLQARIQDRKPPSDGTLLTCDSRGMGTVPDQPFACDLRTSDPAPCVMSAGSEGRNGTLREVGRLAIGAGQQEGSQISVRLPDDAIDWYIEANVVVGDGSPTWIRINSDGVTGETGKPFHSLGLRDLAAGQRYREYIWSMSLLTLFLPQLADLGWKRGNTRPPSESLPSDLPQMRPPGVAQPAPTPRPSSGKDDPPSLQHQS